MSLSIQQPRSYPAVLLKNRRTLPDHLHIFVARPNVNDIYSSQQFNYDALNKSSIEAHFQRNVASSFISLYESEGTALRKRPHTVKGGDEFLSYDAVIVDIDTSGMAPAWISMGDDVHIPVWFEEDNRELDDDHHEEVLWFCLEEVKKVLLVDVNLGEKGEWLACGHIPRSRVTLHSTSSDAEPLQRVSNSEEEHEVDRQSRRERIRIEKDRLRLDQKRLEHIIEEALPSSSVKAPPSIPARKSSLGSLSCKAIGERKKEAREGSKITCKTRDVRITVTNADPDSAASLMKYAILMAHGKRLEGEETWHAGTASEAGRSNRAGSMLTIENEVPKERRSGFAARDIGTPMTPPASSKEPYEQLHTIETSDRGVEEGLSLRRELSQHHDEQCSQEGPRSLYRSAAPSPSHSMLKSHRERGNAASFQNQRSRRDLLVELQSDQDSVLREYAQVSLQDPNILQQVRNDSHHGSSNDDGEIRIHNHEDGESVISHHDRFAASTPSFRVPGHKPRPNHDVQDKGDESPRVEPPAPSSYSTMTSLSSLSDFEHASIGKAIYASVEPASHINTVENVRSELTSESGSGPGSSDRQWSFQTSLAPRPLESQPDAVLEPFPPFNPLAQPEQPDREAPLVPQTVPTPNVFSVVPTLTPTPKPVASKGGAFLARAKCLGEKSREITGRMAEIKERQSKPEAKRDKWGLGKWRSGGKKKDVDKQIGEQDE